MTTAEILMAVTVLVGTGGVVQGLRQALTAKPEAQKLFLSVGESGVKIMSDVLDQVQEENARLITSNEHLHTRMDDAVEDVNELREVLRQRAERIDELEARCKQLERELEHARGRTS